MTIGWELSVQAPPDGRLYTNEQFPFMCFGSNLNGEQALLCLIYRKWIGLLITEKCIGLGDRSWIIMKLNHNADFRRQ